MTDEKPGLCVTVNDASETIIIDNTPPDTDKAASPPDQTGNPKKGGK